MPVRPERRRDEHEAGVRVLRGPPRVQPQGAGVPQGGEREGARPGGRPRGDEDRQHHVGGGVLREVQPPGALVRQVAAQRPGPGPPVLVVVAELVPAEDGGDEERVGQAQEQDLPRERLGEDAVRPQGHQQPHHEEDRDLAEGVVLVRGPDGVERRASDAEQPVHEDGPPAVPDEDQAEQADGAQAEDAGEPDLLRPQDAGDELGRARLVVHGVRPPPEVAVGVQDVGGGLYQARRDQDQGEHDPVRGVERLRRVRRGSAYEHRDDGAVEGPRPEHVPPPGPDGPHIGHGPSMVRGVLTLASEWPPTAK